MPVFEVAVPNSLKDGWSHSCPHGERNQGTKTSTKALDYGATCRTCGLSNPPLIDKNGKTIGDKGYDEKTARNWHSQEMTGERLKQLWADYPFAVADIRILEGPAPVRPKVVPRPGGGADMQRMIDEAVKAAVAKALADVAAQKAAVVPPVVPPAV